MEFLAGSVKLLSEKLTEETIASNQNLRFLSVKLICICSREANVLNSMALHFLNFDSFKYISLLNREWKLIRNKVYFTFLSFVHLLLKKDWLFEATRPKTSAEISDPRVIWYASFRSESVCLHLAAVLNCFEDFNNVRAFENNKNFSS